jgi:hypothetical protein
VNSIFADIDVSAADLYDMFGYPTGGDGAGERVLIALTFAAVPDTGVFDTDMLYRLQLHPHARPARAPGDHSLAGMLRHLEAIRETYFGNVNPAEIRVTVDAAGRASVRFLDFPGGSFAVEVGTNEVVEIPTPDGHRITAFLGGRDDAFFNDLPGFFRSINYAPQFYHVSHTQPDLRELPIPKTLLELEGNTLFNYDPANPKHGRGVKLPLPDPLPVWEGGGFAKDADGNYRFVYSGEDAQAGKNVNAIVLEIPLAFLTRSPERDRVVSTWGESWVLKASSKVDTIPDQLFWREHPWALIDGAHGDEELRRYKVVDTVGQPFADAGLNEREDNRQVGANNFVLVPHFVRRLAHLGWGFGPSITALGIATSFDHDNSPVSVHRTYHSAALAFPRVRKLLFQELRMPDDSWNPHGLAIPLRRPYEVFVPNVCAIDMDTTGSWPFGRRLEDQVATRFLAMFLDMSAPGYHLETLGQQSLWDGAPIHPKTPPNPLRNDKDFLPAFPYLAEPW